MAIDAKDETKSVVHLTVRDHRTTAGEGELAV